jgi:hypothetical protein
VAWGRTVDRNKTAAHAAGEITMDDALIIFAIIAAWLLLQLVVLPKLGVST